MHVTGNVFNSGGDGVLGGEGRVHNYAEAFHLQVGFVQGLKGTAVVEVMIEWDGEVGISDGCDKCGMFSGGRERAETVAVDRDVDGEDWGDFYSSWRGKCQRGWSRERSATG